jgi:hypothetical protein
MILTRRRSKTNQTSSGSVVHILDHGQPDNPVNCLPVKTIMS